MRIMAATALLLLLLVVSLAAEAPTSNTSDTRERNMSARETWRTFTKWKAEHGKTDRSLIEEEEERAYAWFKYRLGLIDHRWHEDGYSVFPWEMGRSEEETRQIFTEWKVRHGKTYISIAEDERRYAIFKYTLRDMDSHNVGYAIGVHRFERGVNEFSDLTMEEFLTFCCGFRPPLDARLTVRD
ncbi:unnamed protein product [Alopecurus aequalis]